MMTMTTDGLKQSTRCNRSLAHRELLRLETNPKQVWRVFSNGILLPLISNNNPLVDYRCL